MAGESNPSASPIAVLMPGLYELWAKRADELLGEAGRMIALSKTGYDEAHPRNIAVFNANVCISTAKVWYGDLDLTTEEARLVDLAGVVGEVVSVLFERDARFKNEQSPRIEAAVFSVAPTGETRFQFQWIERCPDGRLRRRPDAGGDPQLSRTE